MSLVGFRSQAYSDMNRTQSAGIILFMRPANEGRRYSVTPSLIGWTHTQNDPWVSVMFVISLNLNFVTICFWIKKNRVSPWETAECGFTSHNETWRRLFASENWVIIGSCNGLSHVRWQALIKTSADLLSIGPLWRDFSENFNHNANIFFQETGIQNIVCQMSAILFRFRCVN